MGPAPLARNWDDEGTEPSIPVSLASAFAIFFLCLRGYRPRLPGGAVIVVIFNAQLPFVVDVLRCRLSEVSGKFYRSFYDTCSTMSTIKTAQHELKIGFFSKTWEALFSIKPVQPHQSYRAEEGTSETILFLR